ncbi:hypothetical protein N824_10455 [Pedobacter sp. V48]|nr:hypothetical protein N824_10455 [Pedobacter sp. V48]
MYGHQQKDLVIQHYGDSARTRALLKDSAFNGKNRLTS